MIVNPMVSGPVDDTRIVVVDYPTFWTHHFVIHYGSPPSVPSIRYHRMILSQMRKLLTLSWECSDPDGNDVI